MDTEAATNPAGGEDTSADTLVNDSEVGTQFVDDEGNAIDPPEEEEEIELDDDLKLKLPKSQAEKARLALLRQADYTRKTQELAEQRKAFETERQGLSQTTEAELNVYATAANFQQQIASYQRVDWNAWNDTDPFEAQKAFMHFQQIKDAYQNALGQLSHLRQQRISHTQQDTAKRMEEGRASLARDIGWNDDLKAKLLGFAAEYGFSRDELDDLEADPRAAKILHAAYEGREARRQAQKAQGHLAAQQAQPAASVKANRAPPSGLDDRLSIDEWTRRRNEQLRKRG